MALLMFLGGIGQMDGVVGQSFTITVPLTEHGRIGNDTAKARVQATLEHVAALQARRATSDHAPDPAAASAATAPLPASGNDVFYRALAVSVATAVILFLGRYGFIEKTVAFLVVGFTVVSLANFVLLQQEALWAASWADFVQGLQFRLPPKVEGVYPLATALAVFGIIGMAASEIIFYPYWCLEKGSGRNVGANDGSEQWTFRARSWIRVIHWDAWLLSRRRWSFLQPSRRFVCVHQVFALFSVSDLRQTLRRLVRERGFTATVLLTLALCIGANVAIFAVVDAVLIRTLPFPEPERLVTVYNRYPGAGIERSSASLPNYYDRKDGISAFASTSIIRGGSAIIGESGAPQWIPTDQVSPEFFETLGVRLAMGRSFTHEETLYQTSGVAVLTDEFWRSYFSADPNVLGRQFRVNGFDVTVIGVLPPTFRYLSSRAKFYSPAASALEDRTPDNRHSNNYSMIARLAPGISVTQAQAEMDMFNSQQTATDPYAHLIKDARFSSVVVPLHVDHVRAVRPILLLLQGGVVLLLVIGAVNLINLLLVRASGRAKELAVRQALGASRRHVARETLIETVLLAIGGGVLGLALGAVGIRLLDALGTDQLPLGSTIQFDARVAAIAILVSIGVGIVLAIPVVWFNLHGRLANVLHTESRSGTTSRAAQRVRHVFIVAQIGLAFVLLAGAGLLGVSMQRVLEVDPGFRSEQLVTAKINLPWKNYQKDPERVAFTERLIDELRALPGVTSVGVSTAIPFGGDNSDNATTVEGYERPPGESIRTHNVSGNSGDLWQTLGIPLIEGRFLEVADNHSENRVCVVDQALVQRYWPGTSALGRRLVTDVEFKEDEAFTIVGVVGSVKQSELSESAILGAIYFPFKHRARLSMFVTLRTVVAPESLFTTLRQTVLKIDPELPLDGVMTMEERIDDSLIARKSPALLAMIFAAVALALAGVGTYGVLSYAVAQRRREIGVRMALGARPAHIRSQFLLLGAKLLMAGATIGLIGTWFAGRAMHGVLFGVDGFHLGTVLITFAIMGVMSMCACLLPSHRASRVSPLEALSEA